MAERGHRYYGTTQIRVACRIRAPLRYVYAWCTDYRTDDGQFSTRVPKLRYRVLRLSPHRVLRVRLAPNRRAEPYIAVDLVRLRPPAAWHMDQLDETDHQSIDYRLVAIDRTTTELRLLITERWLTPDHPDPRQLRAQVRRTWTRFGTAIEERYRRGVPAIG
jgi:hypothetical protein